MPASQPLRSPPWRALLACLLGGAVGGLGAPAGAQSVTASEHGVRAAYVYNFIKFTEWPDLPPGDDAIVICTDVTGPYRRALQALEGKTAQRRPLRVHDLAPAGPPPRCHVAVVGRVDGAASTAPDRLGPQATLIIGGDAGPAEAAQVIRLFRRGNRVRFDVNLMAAERRGLRLSAKMLKLADNVYRGGDPP